MQKSDYWQGLLEFFPMRPVLFAWIRYGSVLALLWILLTQAHASAWMIGAIVVPIATWCAVSLFKADHASDARSGLKLMALIRFIPFFLEQSLKGGWESALFAIHPKKSVRPGFLSFNTRLPEGRVRLYFVNIVSLLPGTVSAQLQGDELTIHALDIRADNQRALAECEQRIAVLFGIDLNHASGKKGNIS